MLKSATFEDLPFKDFAPRVHSIHRFTHLEYKDFAPVVFKIPKEPEGQLVGEWRPYAACAGEGNTPEGIKRWYPGQGGAHTGKQFCAGCTVQRECKNEADRLDEEWGIWGNEIRHRKRKIEIL